MAITQTQIASSYNFTVEYTDGLAQALKIVVLDSGSTQIYEDDGASTDSTYTITAPYVDTYAVYYYLWDGVLLDWVLDAQQSITILEYKIEALWYYDTGESDPHKVNSDADINNAQEYQYYPSAFFLNNQACPSPPVHSPSISYVAYKLVGGEWVSTGFSNTYSLSSWDDLTSVISDYPLYYKSDGHPIKIVTTISNCSEQIVNDTYLDDGYLITSLNPVNLHAEVQTQSSYNILLSYTYGGQDSTDGSTGIPSLIITPENNSYTKCNVFLYKNNEIIYSYLGLEPGENISYTFDSASKENISEYKVRYYSTNGVDEVYDEFVIDVKEYKPTFTLPTISCQQINENAVITLSNLLFNCFTTDRDLHPVSPDFTPNISYDLYYLNPNSYVWEKQENLSVDTSGLSDDADDYIANNPDKNDDEVSIYLRTKYKYGSSNTVLWSPNKLTMVKLVVAVTNYSTTVTKEVVFPICGTWKLRRMSCGNYRIYNYTQNIVNYTIDEIVDSQTVVPFTTKQVGPLSFVALDFAKDGVYKITGGGTYKYIFNYCSIESCILELQRRVLLDDTLCDACRLDKVLYQKALRILPIYETWKKLLDKDWVYEIQYLNSDIDGNLAAVYDAIELYQELRNLCETCTMDSERCSCKK